MHKEEGRFLIRESRSNDDSYTLSLCHNGSIKNFRIRRNSDKSLSLVDPASDGKVEKMCGRYDTLQSLVSTHLREKVCVCLCVCVCGLCVCVVCLCVCTCVRVHIRVHVHIRVQ